MAVPHAPSRDPGEAPAATPRRLAWWLAGAMAMTALTLAIGWVRRDYWVDDGFIFARVARNVAEGQSWGFNPGQPVNVNTSVLWTVVLMALAPTGFSQVALVAVFGAGVLATGLGVERLSRELGRPAAVALGVVCVTLPTLWQSAGLETSLESALVVWSVVCFYSGREVLSGALLGLAVLARPDAALLGCLLLSHRWLTQRRIPWRMATVALLVALPWLLFAWYHFGDIVPVTLRAKTAQSALGWWKQQPPFPLAALLDKPYCIPAAILTAAGVVLRRRAGRAIPAGLPVFVAYGFLHALAYAAIRAPSGYRWYYVPLHLSLLVGGAWGLDSLVTVARRWVRRDNASAAGSAAPREITAAAACLALAAWFTVQTAQAAPYRWSRAYREIGRVIQDRTPSGDTVAAAEIGYIGFFSDRPILDIHGLIHPEASARIAKGEALWWLERKPKFVVTHVPPWFGEPGGAESADPRSAFAAEYRVTAVVSYQGHESLALWERLPVVESRR